jgi:hypothetical protein
MAEQRRIQAGEVELMATQVTARDGVNDTHWAWECPNCVKVHDTRSEGSCFLELVAVILRDRGTVCNETIANACESVDVDELWERFGGPAADWLEEQALELDRSEP